MEKYLDLPGPHVVQHGPGAGPRSTGAATSAAATDIARVVAIACVCVGGFCTLPKVQITKFPNGFYKIKHPLEIKFNLDKRKRFEGKEKG